MSYLIVEAAGTGPDAEAARLELLERLIATDERHGKAEPDAQLKLWRQALEVLMRSPLFPPGDRLRIWRHASERGRLNGTRAAELLSVSLQTWTNWETGRYCPHPLGAQAIECLTGIPAADWR